MRLERQAGPGHRGSTSLGVILVQWKTVQGLKQKRVHFVVQKASRWGQCGRRLREASSEPPGDQQSGRLGWWLRDGEKKKDWREI